MKRVFITGATGFLGGKLAKTLHKMGYQVTASGRNQKKGKNLEDDGIEFINIDLSQKTSLEILKKDFDWVFHCAALSSPWGAYKKFYKANVLATENLFEYFSHKSLERLVYVSSPSIYADLKNKTMINENSSLPSLNLNHYIYTKKVCENIVDKYVSHHQMPIITLRPQGIIGDGDPSIFPRLLKTAQKGFLPKIGRKETFLDLTYIDNVVHALICAAKADTKYIGEKYNITNDQPINLYTTLENVFSSLNIDFKWKKLSQKKALFIGSSLEKFFALLPKDLEPPLTRYTVCTFAFDRTLDISKAKADLKYRPLISMEKALDLCISSMRKELEHGKH